MMINSLVELIRKLCVGMYNNKMVVYSPGLGEVSDVLDERLGSGLILRRVVVGEKGLTANKRQAEAIGDVFTMY